MNTPSLIAYIGCATFFGALFIVWLLWHFFANTVKIFAYTIRDTRKWPIGLKTPLIFIGNLFDHTVARCKGEGLEISPSQKLKD